MDTINRRWNLFPTPGETDGVQIRLKDSLSEQIPKIKNKLNGCKTIKIKVSGDGTNIGKRLHILNVIYTIIRPGFHYTTNATTTTQKQSYYRVEQSSFTVIALF